jgi:hypothetical protein
VRRLLRVAVATVVSVVDVADDSAIDARVRRRVDTTAEVDDEIDMARACQSGTMRRDGVERGRFAVAVRARNERLTRDERSTHHQEGDTNTNGGRNG